MQNHPMEKFLLRRNSHLCRTCGFFQMAHGSSKSGLDLFERRHAIYEIVRTPSAKCAHPQPCSTKTMRCEFMEAMERAYFFRG